MIRPARRAGAWMTALTLALLASGGCRPAPEETRLRFTAMGTLVDVTIYDVDAETAQAAAGRVERMFHALHAAWDPWGTGALGRLNEALGQGETGKPDEDLSQLLASAATFAEASGGTFDPTVGSLVRLWGFSRDEAMREVPPDAGEIQAALARSRPLAEAIGPDGSITGVPGMAIDLGGFAKGVAVQRAVDMLLAEGIDNAIVNAGGDLRAVGRHGDRPWRVGVREPRGPGVLAVIETAGDESVFTSGDYERFFVHEGRRYHHILDPRSGYPAEGLASVTVIHGEAGLADAAATALLVAGPREWPGVAAALGVGLVMVVTTEGVIEATPAMEARLAFPGDAPPTVRPRALP
jgi:thiamine biosynthesis lipoprotein